MNSLPTNSNSLTMKSTKLPKADTMSEYRSISKGCQDRLMQYDSSPIKWNLSSYVSYGSSTAKRIVRNIFIKICGIIE